MKVRLLQNKYHHEELATGDVIEVDDDLAKLWIGKGQAEKARPWMPITRGLALEGKTVEELKPAAQDLKIEGTSKLRKSELVEEIRAADAAQKEGKQ